MRRPLWQYQRLAEAPRQPGAETVVAPTQPPQEQPFARFRQRGLQAALLVAAAPFFFFDPEPIPQPAFTQQIEQAVSQPQFESASRLHLAESFFFHSQPFPPLTAQTQAPTRQPSRATPPITLRAPHFFFQEAPFTAQIEQAISQPLVLPPERTLAPSFFFDSEPVAAAFTDQPLQAISEPLRVPSRVHSYPGFFFDPEPVAAAFADQIEQAISQPVVIEPHRVTSGHFFFDPFPRPFDQQIEQALSQPLPRRADHRHLVHGFFFDPEPIAAAFTGQPEQAISQPMAQVASRRHLAPGIAFVPDRSGFAVDLVPSIDSQPSRIVRARPHLAAALFFQEAPAEVFGFSDSLHNQPLRRASTIHLAPFFFFVALQDFATQPEQAISEPSFGRVLGRRHTLPEHFAPVSQDPVAIFVPGWFQPASEPARAFAIGLANARFLVASAPSEMYVGEPIAAASMVQFGVITRNVVSPVTPIYFEATLKTSNASYPAKAELYNITDAGVVAGSTIQTTSLTPIRVRSGALTLPTAAKEYRADFGGQASVGATYTIYSADLTSA